MITPSRRTVLAAGAMAVLARGVVRAQESGRHRSAAA